MNANAPHGDRKEMYEAIRSLVEDALITALIAHAPRRFASAMHAGASGQYRTAVELAFEPHRESMRLSLRLSFSGDDSRLTALAAEVGPKAAVALTAVREKASARENAAAREHNRELDIDPYAAMLDALVDRGAPHIVDAVTRELEKRWLAVPRDVVDSSVFTSWVATDASDALDIVGLVYRQTRGDTTAAAELVARLRPQVQKSIRKLTSRYRYDDAAMEDIEQDVWLRYARMKLDPSRAASLRGWIRRVVTCAAIDYIRGASDLADSGGDTDFPDSIEKDTPPSADLSDVHSLLLHTLFDGSSPPHQAITFALHVPLELELPKIVLAHAATTLSEVADIVFVAYGDGEIPAAELQELAQPFLESLRQPLATALRDPTTRRVYRDLMWTPAGRTRPTGQSCLACYGTGDLVQNMYDWIGNTRRRLYQRLKDDLPAERESRTRRTRRMPPKGSTAREEVERTHG